MQLIAQNKKASWNYEFIKTYTAGIVLKGSEVKSIRAKNVNINDAHARFFKHELFIINMHIAQYKGAQNKFFNHEPSSTRKLLLTKRELSFLLSKAKEKGLAIVPTKVFISDKNYVKLEIALAKGKREFDKRNTLKNKEIQKDQSRELKKWITKH